jgi:hypothetical protein
MRSVIQISLSRARNTKCTEEACTLTYPQKPCLKDGSKMESLLREDESTKIPTLQDSSIISSLKGPALCISEMEISTLENLRKANFMARVASPITVVHSG